MASSYTSSLYGSRPSKVLSALMLFNEWRVPRHVTYLRSYSFVGIRHHFLIIKSEIRTLIHWSWLDQEIMLYVRYVCYNIGVNTLTPRQNGRNFACSSAFSWMKTLELINPLPTAVYVMACPRLGPAWKSLQSALTEYEYVYQTDRMVSPLATAVGGARCIWDSDVIESKARFNS